MRASQGFTLGIFACLYGGAKMSDSKEVRLCATLLSVMLVLCTIFLRKWRKWKNKKAPDELHIPGPLPSDPITGNWLDIQQAGSVHKYITSLSQQYGPIGSFYWGRRRATYISSPTVFSESENAKQLMTLNRKPLCLFHGIQSLIGTNCIQFSNGNVFSFKMKSLFIPIYGSITNDTHYRLIWKDLITKWSKESNEGNAIDIVSDLFRSTTDCMMLSLFGVVEHEDTKKVSMDIMNAFKACLSDIESEIVLYSEPEEGDAVKQMIDKSRDRLSNAIHKMLDLKANSGSTTDSNLEDEELDDLVSLMQRSNQLYPDRKCIVNECISVLFGAHKMYHGLLSICDWMATHDGIQSEIVHEIKGKKDVEDVMELKQCRKVIVEALSKERCLVQWTSRVCNTKDINVDTVLMDGTATTIQIPRGMPIIFTQEAWNGVKAKHESVGNEAMFGGIGGRKCPGQKWFEMQILMFVTMVLPKFKFVPRDGKDKENEVEFRHGLINEVSQPLCFRVVKR